MDLNQKIIAALLVGFFAIALIRVFRTPLRVALKLLLNTLLGFLALWAVNLTAAWTGIALGLNLIGVTKLKVADYLPAIVYAPLLCWIVSLPVWQNLLHIFTKS